MLALQDVVANTITQHCHCTVKAAIDYMETNGCDLVSIKICVKRGSPLCFAVFKPL